MSTYDYLKTESTEERVPKDADISVAENLRLLQVGDRIDVYSPITEDWTYASVLKASDDWIETIFTDGEVVVFSLDEMPIWKNEGFDIRSAV
tara:strand:- start:2395 stop:2670 length:276 start_codon:yes stop_codon:yes gene_type:complete